VVTLVGTRSPILFLKSYSRTIYKGTLHEIISHLERTMKNLANSHLIKLQNSTFIAYGDGPDHLRIIKDRLNAYYGAKIAAATLSWYIKSYK